MAMSDRYAIVLAAGHGKRMKSALPKVMHTVAGRPLVYYSVTAALSAGARRAVVVVGHGREQVVPYLAESFAERISIAVQHEIKGTGSATAQAIPALPKQADRVLILCGDTPLLRPEDLHTLVDALVSHPSAPLAMLTCVVDEPTGYGRIIRDNAGCIREVREHRDLESDAQRAIREVNPGVYCACTAFLRESLSKLNTNNAQGELYLTDIVSMAASSGGTVGVAADASSLVGVNDRAQLAAAETVMQARIIERLRRSGVTVRDGAVIHDTVCVSPDVTIGNGAALLGNTTVAAGAIVGIGCVVDSTHIGEGATLLPYTVVTDSDIEANAVIGPFAYICGGRDCSTLRTDLGQQGR